MQRFGLRAKIYPTLGIAGWIFGFSGAAVAGVEKINTNNLPVTLAGFAPFVTYLDNCWWLVPVLAAAVAVTAAGRKIIAEPWIWQAIHSAVDGYREFVFQAERGEPIDHHRVTLFRHFSCYQYPCCFKRPLERRLIPVERSGHLKQNTNTDFIVPDEAEKATGVAGQVWRTFQTLVVSELPDLSNNPSEEEIKLYARRTWNSVEWVKNRMKNNKSLARSICGIPIRVKGKEWGIIVIDSVSPTAVTRSSNEFYDLMGRSLSKLLERV